MPWVPGVNSEQKVSYNLIDDNVLIDALSPTSFYTIRWNGVFSIIAFC